MQDPINNVQWLPYTALDANDYNPNVVFGPELKLLELSIMLTGWVQPVLARKEDKRIIDGFHRWMLTKESKALLGRYGGLLPVVVLDITRPQAMLLTIRMNRAKGTHVGLRMAAIMKELVDVHGYTEEQIAPEIGATLEEVRLLHQNDIFKARNLSGYRYSKAWVPAESRLDGAPPPSPGPQPGAR